MYCVNSHTYHDANGFVMGLSSQLRKNVLKLNLQLVNCTFQHPKELILHSSIQKEHCNSRTIQSQKKSIPNQYKEHPLGIFCASSISRTKESNSVHDYSLNIGRCFYFSHMLPPPNQFPSSQKTRFSKSTQDLFNLPCCPRKPPEQPEQEQGISQRLLCTSTVFLR